MTFGWRVKPQSIVRLEKIQSPQYSALRAHADCTKVSWLLDILHRRQNIAFVQKF